MPTTDDAPRGARYGVPAGLRAGRGARGDGSGVHDEHSTEDAAAADRRTWAVVVPVKDARHGKTRLSTLLSAGHRAELVRAMAMDTVNAALACDRVARVLVVTADPSVASEVSLLERATVVAEPSHVGRRSGLDAAVLAGAAAARSEGTVPVAALLGDVPALQPADLAAALTAADHLERGLVTDAPGTGTTLLTVGPHAELDPRFGTGSAAAHRRVGHVPLDVPAGSTLRRDVDVPADLRAATLLPLGPRTAALIDGLPGLLAGETG